MSYANGTTHYNLPITTGSDKRDWADTNQAFEDIDAAIYQASEDASTAGSGVTTLDNQINGVGGIDARLTQAESDIDDVEGAVSTLQGTVSGHTTAIADVRRDLQDNIEAFNEPTATSTHAYAIGDYFYYNDILYKATSAISIGDTIVPNTNCTAIDVMSEVAELKSDIDDVKSDLNRGSVSVTGNGVKTLATLLNELFALVDATKISRDSVLAEGDFNARLVRNGTTYIEYGYVGRLCQLNSYVVEASGSTSYKVDFSANTLTRTERSSDVVTDGKVITLYY